MRRYRFVTVDVFTDTRFGGNPLAVFPQAEGLSDAEMQALASELNLAETTFVLPPDDPANSARVRIFNRVAEMPFAGHPNVGTGWVLAREGRAPGGVLRFEEIAGLVTVQVNADGTTTIAAPQPLTLGPEMATEAVAHCLGLPPDAVMDAPHRPVMASVGNSFVLARVRPDALARAVPNIAAFSAALEAHPALAAALGPRRLPIYAYAMEGGSVRARMFSPLSGNMEDPATGSAATPLAGMLLRLSGEHSGAWDIVQGVEMGRPSLLRTTAHHAADGIRATVGGGSVPVLEGEAML